MTVLGGLGIGKGIVDSALSMWQQSGASKEIRKKLGLIEEKEARDNALFNKQYYSDISKRTEIQNMLRILSENQKKADKAVAARAAVTGATPEQQLASREVNRRTYADSLADMASNASQMRDQYARDKQNSDNATFATRMGMQDQLAGIHSNTAAQMATAANNDFGTGGQLFAYGLGGLGQGNVSWKPIAPVKASAGAGTTYITPPPAADAGAVLDAGMANIKNRLGL